MLKSIVINQKYSEFQDTGMSEKENPVGRHHERPAIWFWKMKQKYLMATDWNRLGF